MRGSMAEEAEDHGVEPEVVDVVVPDEQGGNEERASEPESSRTPSEIETLAEEMGWSPKDKWRGDPDKWKPAKDFVKSTVDVNRSLSKDVRELRENTERVLKAQSKIIDREVERRVAEATQRFHQAVADGDSQEAFRASEEIRHAKQAVVEEEPPASNWQRNNAWYGTHTEASDLAYGVCERLAKQGRSQAEQLAEAEKAVRKAFPDLFESKPKSEPKQAPPPVHGGQRSTQGQPRAKGWNDIPSEYRSAAERNLTRWGLTKEAYAKVFFEENS